MSTYEREEGRKNGERRRREGGGRRRREGYPTIPPGYLRDSYSLSHGYAPPAPGIHRDADLKVDVCAAHMRPAEVCDERPCGSVWEKPMGRCLSCTPGPQECYRWYERMRRVAPSVPRERMNDWIATG